MRPRVLAAASPPCLPFLISLQSGTKQGKCQTPSKSECMLLLLIPEYHTRHLENDPLDRLEVQNFDPMRQHAHCSDCIMKQLLKDKCW